MVLAPRLTREELNKATNGALERLRKKWVEVDGQSFYIGSDDNYAQRTGLVKYLGKMAALEADIHMKEDGTLSCRYCTISEDAATTVINTLIIAYLVQLSEINIVTFSWYKNGTLHDVRITLEEEEHICR